MHTFIIASLSADGYLADKTDTNSTSWTSKEDLRFFVERTKKAGAIVMGSTTYATIGHPLKDRLNIVYTSHPENITGSQPLITPGVKAAPTPGVDVYTTNLSPQDLVAKVEELGYQELAVCGGASIYTLFLNAGVVQTLYLTYEPILFGQGIPLFTAPLRRQLELVSSTPLSPQTMLHEYNVL